MKIDLNNQDGFAVASAMRGPDMGECKESAALKRALTARLRYLATGERETGSLFGYSVCDAPVAEGEAESLRGAVMAVMQQHRHGAMHYLSHVEQAAAALERLLYREAYVETGLALADDLRRREREARRLAELTWALRCIAERAFTETT